MKWGRYNITAVNFGNFRLDGGSMFGSVPKTLWEKRMSCDEQNRIELATRCLILEGDGRKILIDTGCGSKWNDKLKAIYAVEHKEPEALGIDPSSITEVILTHLHFDHGGGLTRYSDAGELELTYPNARIIVQDANFKNAKDPTPKERASYLKENWGPLEDADCEFVDGDVEVLPDVFVHRMDGHTTGQQWIEIRNDSSAMVFPSDLIPTSHHLPVPFHMGYDICAGTILVDKEEFLSHAVQHEWIVVFQHDPDLEAARITKNEKGHYAPEQTISLSS